MGKGKFSENRRTLKLSSPHKPPQANLSRNRPFCSQISWFWLPDYCEILPDATSTELSAASASIVKSPIVCCFWVGPIPSIAASGFARTCGRRAGGPNLSACLLCPSCPRRLRSLCCLHCLIFNCFWRWVARAWHCASLCNNQ